MNFFHFFSSSRLFTFLVDDVDEETYRSIQRWLNPLELGALILEVVPYKYYTAKPAKAPDFKYVQYWDYESESYRYNGTIQVEFIAYNPFAYSFFNSLDEYTYESRKYFYNSE